MREVSSLAWPASPYTSAHRPIARHQLLLTGVVIGADGWAAVHLPVHRTRTMSAATVAVGVHAVLIDDLAPSTGEAELGEQARVVGSGDSDAGGWLILDRLLLAARRQAAAVAGDGLGPHLDTVWARLHEAGHAAAGIGSLRREWPAPGQAPARATAGRAQLLELEGQALPGPAEILVQEYPVPTATGTRAGPAAQRYLIELVAAAAAVALAGAAASGRYDLGAGVDLPWLLDAAAGDLLAFTDLSSDTNTGTTAGSATGSSAGSPAAEPAAVSVVAPDAGGLDGCPAAVPTGALEPRR